MDGYTVRIMLNNARLRFRLSAGEQMLYLELADVNNR